MSKLFVMQGIPGSGKSTMAKQMIESGEADVRVNRDLLREMLHFGKWSKKNEKEVISVEYAIVLDQLFDHKNVIVDDTNLTSKTLDMWWEAAQGLECDFEIVRMDTPTEECIERDRLRDRTVGETVIRKWAAIKEQNVGPYVPRDTAGGTTVQGDAEGA